MDAFTATRSGIGPSLSEYAQHDPAGEFLFPPLNLPDNESGPDEPFQIVLFE
jgi:hypothetical protein